MLIHSSTYQIRVSILAEPTDIAIIYVSQEAHLNQCPTTEETSTPQSPWHCKHTLAGMHASHIVFDHLAFAHPSVNALIDKFGIKSGFNTKRGCHSHFIVCEANNKPNIILSSVLYTYIDMFVPSSTHCWCCGCGCQHLYQPNNTIWMAWWLDGKKSVLIRPSRCKPSGEGR